jgi:anti-anti-sigma regulatory factor
MLELTVTPYKQDQTLPPVTVLQVAGKLDGSNYKELVAKAEALVESGARNLLLDLGKLTFISSAGISALHRVALLFQGKKKVELEEGWAAFRAIERDGDSGVQKHVKLLNPNEDIIKVLELVSFTRFFEIHTDIDTAVASFQS